MPLSVTSPSLLKVLLFLLCFVAGTWEIMIKRFAVPRSVSMGKDVALRCEYELDYDESEFSVVVKWFWIPTSSPTNEKILLYQRISGETNFIYYRHPLNATEEHNNDTIVMRNMEPSSSGLYECSVSTLTSDDQQNGTLIVINAGTGPLLYVTKIQEEPADDDHKLIHIICRVDNVTPKPNLIVTINDYIVDVTAVAQLNYNTRLYKAFVNVIVTISDEVVKNQNEVRCEMNFFETMGYNDEILFVAFETISFNHSNSTELNET